ncbi:MAG: tRNA (adenosine(37)-N6)-dimethylallyltransferase MiaA [Clostridium sp.]|nr:tRNA (adenosine(37)-N6)-dimethylallyltransferase MiaA [Clostridium sp.]
MIQRDEITNRQEKKPLVIITGPTAVGKTALSLQIAKTVNGEIISADSMQVYRMMDIGTAKIRPEEMQGIRHHLINVLDPKEEFNVVTFQAMAGRALKEIYEKGKLPIIAGGTGFYIQSVLYDIAFENIEVSEYRRELTEYYEHYGARALHQRLKDVDEASYREIHENNVKRVIRALEFYHDTGYPISRHNREQRSKESPYCFVYFVLNDDRRLLYERIEKRIELMLEQGLAEEVRRLIDYGCTREMISMQGLGYKEMISYLEGDCSLEEAVYRLKRDTRHFAKRQLTWFRREQDVIWVNRPDYASEEEMLTFMCQCMRDKGIITDEIKNPAASNGVSSL